MATVVAFHAHPDDEVLLTGGTIAMLAARGHRVVIVLACSVPMGGPGTKGSERLDQLSISAETLGAARVVYLGYADSGRGPILYPDPPGGIRFARADLEEAAGRLAQVLRDEHADLLLSYDPRGGYGHPDHVKVHQVGARAAELTGTRVLEATVPRELVGLLFTPARLGRLVNGHHGKQIRAGFTPRDQITHRVSVRRFARAKQAALAAHTSYTNSSGRSARLARVAVAMPVPLFAVALGREWFAEPGATATTVSRDLLRPAR
ncbi:MAG TPA: PIG-L family deacetylase [Streptosporangiaceae bacterium]|nr:PIG-L family deacetylase [Streptosporangiaceae bacterium]